MKISKSILYTALGFCALSIIGAALAPKVRAAVRAALVEVVIPSKPYFGGVLVGTAGTTFGPGTGTLGVSAITITNLGTLATVVSIGGVIPTTPGSCDGATMPTGPLSAVFFAAVPANSTIHLTYPTPLTFTGQNGNASCIFAQTPTLPVANVYVNGFVN